MFVRALGCVRDFEDRRDLRMREVVKKAAIILPKRLPSEIDYTSKMSPVRDQGDEGTCVAFAGVAGVRDYQEKKEQKKKILLSTRYAYWRCKQEDELPDEEGTYPRILVRVLQRWGTPPEKIWPYTPRQKDANSPPVNADKLAWSYRIKTYARVYTVFDMKQNLLLNGPFLAGVEVFKSWFSDLVVQTGKIPMPKKKERSLGGHAICIMGYDDRLRFFKFKNSWGTEWGEEGYGYLPYEYMEAYFWDGWSMTDLVPNPAPLVRQKAARNG